MQTTEKLKKFVLLLNRLNQEKKIPSSFESLVHIAGHLTMAEREDCEEILSIMKKWETKHEKENEPSLIKRTIRFIEEKKKKATEKSQKVSEDEAERLAQKIVSLSESQEKLKTLLWEREI